MVCLQPCKRGKGRHPIHPISSCCACYAGHGVSFVHIASNKPWQRLPLVWCGLGVFTWA